MKNISTYDRVKHKITQVEDLYGKTEFTKWFPEVLCIADFISAEGKDTIYGTTLRGDKVELSYNARLSHAGGVNAVIRLRLNGHVVSFFGAVSGGQFDTDKDVYEFKSLTSLWSIVEHTAYEAEMEAQKKAKELWLSYRKEYEHEHKED